MPLDPDQWAVVMDFAIVRRGQRYVQEQPARYRGVSSVGHPMHIQLQGHEFNAIPEGQANGPSGLAPGELERQVITRFQEAARAAEGIQGPSTGPDSVSVVMHEDRGLRELTMAEVWAD